MKILYRLAAFTAATVPFVPAIAETPIAADRTAIVTYADLDLNRGEDVRTLDRRLRSAIEQVCGPVSSADPAGARAVRQCRAELRDRVASRRAQALARSAGGQPILVALEE
jgi:UrcA family protein